MSYIGGPYHTETSPLIWRENQWTGFYMTETSVMKELMGSTIKQQLKLENLQRTLIT